MVSDITPAAIGVRYTEFNIAVNDLYQLRDCGNLLIIKGLVAKET